MAVVDLGTRTLEVGSLPAVYDPFPYDETLAYGIGAIFASPDFDNIFSYAVVNFEIAVPSQPAFELQPSTQLEIKPGVKLFYFAASPLFRGNGTCTIIVERFSFYRGGVDTVPLTLQLLYDNAVTVATWRG